MKKPLITKEMIKVRATEASYSRGEQYYRNGAIFNTVKRGDFLEGFCEAGSQSEPYYVRAEVSNKGIGTTSCTCWYEYGGDCKHIVALLLNYHYQPEAFEEHPSLEETLNLFEKSELIGLISKMIKRYPDLQALIDLPMPSRIRQQTPVNVDGLRKQLQRDFKSYDPWDNRAAEHTLESIVETGQEFGKAGDWQNASVIYRMILEEIAKNNRIVDRDEEGNIASIVTDVINRLAECLDHLADDDAERYAILDALLTVYFQDIENGSDFGDEAGDVVLRYARTADLPRLRQKLNQLHQAVGRRSHWVNESFAEFEAQLDILDNVDPEVTLSRLREEGLYSLLVGKLLEMNRADEAVQVVEQHITGSRARLRELYRLSAAGRDDDAIRLAQQTLKQNYDRQLVEWLLGRLEARGDHKLLFEWELRRMKAQPSESHYASLKKASLAVGNWESVRTELIRQLQKDQQYDVLTLIYLHDEEWDQAWETLAKVPEPSGFHASLGWGVKLDLQVAERSRMVRPAKALPVYLKYVRKSIDERNRDSYRKAAEYLAIARELYLKLDDSASWSALIQEIRTEFKRLPALQDELDKAGL